MESAVLTTQMQGMSLEQEFDIAPNHALFSWMEEEETMFANDAFISKTLQVQCDYNTRSKRRFTGESIVSHPINPQLKSVSDQTPGTSTVSSPSQPQKEIIIARTKEKKPLSLSPFNVVEQLNKSSANVSLWDILAILEQKTLL